MENFFHIHCSLMGNTIKLNYDCVNTVRPRNFYSHFEDTLIFAIFLALLTALPIELCSCDGFGRSELVVSNIFFSEEQRFLSFHFLLLIIKNLGLRLKVNTLQYVLLARVSLEHSRAQ